MSNAPAPAVLTQRQGAAFREKRAPVFKGK